MMDAVEFSLPAVVAVSKLLNTQDFSRGAVTPVEEAEVRKTETGSIFGTPSPINGCVSSCSPKDIIRVVTTSEQDSVHRKAEVGLCRDEKQHFNFQGEKVTEHCGNVNSSLFMLPKSANKQTNRKAGKVQKKSRVVKQKHGHDGKCVKAKAKLDPFFSKSGLLSPNSAVGGNNILGLYGLKSDIHNVTKHVDELSLNELLDGSYECSNLCQDKRKKAANTNENTLHLVRKACSILQLKRPVQSQNSFELDGSSNKKAPSLLGISGSCGTSSMDCDEVDKNATDLTSSSEIHDSCSKPGVSVNVNHSSLLQPEDILECLALPPAKDLESLLLDVAKPALSSRSSTDLCPSKLTSKRVGLPSLSLSHSIGVSCKTNADVAKLCTSKGTCQARWVRIGSTASFIGDARSCFSDVDSLTYDHSLVPSRGLKVGLSEDEKVPSLLVKNPWHEPSSSTARFHPAFHIPGAEQDMKYQDNSDILKGPSPNNFLFQEHKDNHVEIEKSKSKSDGSCTSSCYCSSSKSADDGCHRLLSNSLMPENSKQAVHSPRLLAAAQILCDIASDFRKQNQNNGKIRWPKKPSQKAMKACKSKSPTGKAVMSVQAKSVTGSVQLTLSKPPKFHSADKKKDLDYTNNLGRGLITWSTPASTSSSHSKLEVVPDADSKLLNVNVVNLLGMKPFPTRVLEKACDSHLKPRKSLTVDWGRRRYKKE
ncbi:hypothetical protein NE237_026911 [Protea cynaroides]|uniref:Uncharacterized protein n=1 Tax=Protea cynaroides TaxID=273540 RepID=A0A9Q0GQU4_9MAGN|nr:hypothetical protein NE237_026911 [Protea cynaroides]